MTIKETYSLIFLFLMILLAKRTLQKNTILKQVELSKLVCVAYPSGNTNQEGNKKSRITN